MKNELNNLIVEFTKKLGGALLSCDLLSTKEYKILASYNSNVQATVILGKLIIDFRNTIEKLGLPPVEKFQIINLEMNTLLLAVYLDNDHILSSIIDKSKITYGLLFSIIPNLVADFEQIVSKK